MAMREVKAETFLMIAHSLGGLSTCDRAAIGAVITRQGRCVSWGYNGAPPGLPHCDENRHGWQSWYELHDTGKHNMEALYPDKVKQYGCRNATHAEANAIAAAAREGISTDGTTL